MEGNIKSKIYDYLKVRLIDRKAMFIPFAAVMMFMLVGYAAVDSEAPVINTDVISLGYGEKLDQDMLDITDNVDSIDEMVVIINDEHVDYKQIGTYAVDVTAVDRFNNETVKTIHLEIMDNQAPEIQKIGGESGYYIEVPIYGSKDLSSYIKAVDNVEGDVTPFIIQDKELDTSIQGIQVINVEVSDTTGNVTKEELHFSVADLEAPTITYKNGKEVFVDYKCEFDINNYLEIKDNVDTELDIKIKGSVDSSKLNDVQTLEVTAKDKAGNVSKAKLKATVKDVTGPKIVLSRTKVKVEKGQSFDPKKYIVSAIDNSDGDLKDKITFNTISTSSTGTKTVTYTGVDKAGNKSTATLTVEVTFPGLEIVKTAYTKLGTPYRWGATGPSSFDCSGFTQWVYRQNGIYIPRTSGAQKSAGKTVPLSQLQAGDIVWRSGHVGIYIGGGKYIHAPHTGSHVKVASMSSGHFTCGVRY